MNYDELVILSEFIVMGTVLAGVLAAIFGAGMGFLINRLER
jgi:hypothetical protein